MKFNMQSLGYLFLAGLIGFTSCKKDEEETPAPTLVINSNSLGSDQTGGSASTGASVSITLTAEASEGISKISSFKVIGSTETSIGTAITSFPDSKKHTWTTNYTVVETSGTVGLKYTVEDKKGKITSKTFTITIGSDYKAFTSVVVFAPLSNNTSKTFLSLSTGTTYTFTEASSNSAAIDLGYFYGGTSNASFACPSDYLTTAYDLSGWAVRNSTSYRTTSGVDFDGANSSASLGTAYDNGTAATNGTIPAGGDTRIYNLSDGQIVAFKTNSNKKGIIKVVSRTGSAPNINLTISVKVQD